jgi:hypothetical protein
MLPKCGDCGASVSNLVQHYGVCPKRKKGPERIEESEKVIVVERHAGGRPKKHEVCSICGGAHYAKGLCRVHYHQEYHKDKAEGSGNSVVDSSGE